MGWITTKFGTGFHGAQRMKPNDFVVYLTHLARPAGQSFPPSSQISSGRIGTEVCTDVHGSQMTHLTALNDPLIFNLAPL